jgi:putative Mg2+ transporter-C (MgtC) family protein
MLPLMHNETTLSQIASLLIAAVLGGLIGLEREAEQRPAGLRTYMLVCVGSALFTMLSIYAFPGATRDTARVAAQIVTGIGFLGAGTVWRAHDHVTGLTTAAGLWVAAAIGMAVGAGLGALALAATILVLIVLAVILRLERTFLHHDHRRDDPMPERADPEQKR